MGCRYMSSSCFLLVLFALFFTTGCSTKSGSPSPNAPNFLKVGNKWKYVEVDTAFSMAVDTLTYTITGINSDGEYVVADTSTYQGTSLNYWYMNGTSLMGYGSGTSKSKSPF